MKAYKFEITLIGTCVIEDPNCPLGWKGSGCYDVSVPAQQEVELTVVAEDEASARKIVDECEFRSYDRCSLDDIEEVDVKPAEVVEEEDDGPAGIVDAWFETL